MIDELTLDSPRAVQPPGFRVALYPHQLALLHQALAFEEQPRTAQNSACTAAYFGAFPNPESYSFRPRIGVLGDKPGAGKSFVALGIVALKRSVAMVPETVGFCDVNLLALAHSDFACVNTNVVVAPHTLFPQWQEYLARTDLAHVGINGKRALGAFDCARAHEYDVVLVSATCFRGFAAAMRDAHGPAIKVSRVFFDGFETLNVDGELRAGFFWLITSAYRSVLDPSARRRPGYRDAMDVLGGRGFMHRLVRACDASVPTGLMGALIVKSADAFVDAVLPRVEHDVIPCKDPHATAVLQDAVTPAVVELLASATAENLEGAVAELGLSRAGDERGLMHAVTRGLRQTIHNLEVSVDASMSVPFSGGDEDRDAFVKPVLAKLGDARRRMASIAARIEVPPAATVIHSLNQANGEPADGEVAALVCCVCFEPPQPRTVVKCCANSYCLGCIVEWVRRQNSCPTCKRVDVTRDMLVVLTPGGTTYDAPGDASTVTELGCFPHANSKVHNLRILLEALSQQPDRRVLLFSSHDSSFTAVLPVLLAIHMPFAILKGSAGRVHKCVQMFNRGDIRLLLMNTTYAGAGLNLPAATDVIMFQRFDTEAKKQIIGRAQRPGRTTPLVVHYLLHANEMASGSASA